MRKLLFRWMRVFGDTIFAVGAVALTVFVLGLRTGGSGRRTVHVGDSGIGEMPAVPAKAVQ